MVNYIGAWPAAGASTSLIVDGWTTSPEAIHERKRRIITAGEWEMEIERTRKAVISRG